MEISTIGLDLAKNVAGSAKSSGKSHVIDGYTITQPDYFSLVLAYRVGLCGRGSKRQ